MSDGGFIERRLPISAGVKALNPRLFSSTLAIAEKKPKRKEHTIKLNGTETRMMDWLEARKRAGEIREAIPHGMRLRHSIDAEGHFQTYTPDFVVTENDGSITLIETKGEYIHGKDITRYKSCRSDWPQFRFEAWQWVDRQWSKIL